MTKSHFQTAARQLRASAGIISCVGFLLCTACASAPPVSDAERASWTKEAARAVESGHIVHLGQGEGETVETAVRRAEAQALQNISNECSFVPNSARIDERAVSKTSTGHHAWARGSLGLESCEEAKRAVDPAAIRRLANSGFTKQVYHYQQEQADHELLISLADPADREGGEESVAPPPAPIRDEIHFYVVRQQVVFAKQEIILAEKVRVPATAGAVAKDVAKSRITARTANLRKFEESHPEFKRTPRNWSNYGREAVLHSPWVSPLVRQPNPPVGKERAARWLNLRAQESDSERAPTKRLKKAKKARAKRPL